jgi:hypothetical protein
VSYNEVARAYPSDKDLTHIAGMKVDDDTWGDEFDKVLGELFTREFFRVVLDEGHAIRNPTTKSASAHLFLSFFSCIFPPCLEVITLLPGPELTNHCDQPPKPASTCPRNIAGYFQGRLYTIRLKVFFSTFSCHSWTI